ncbi:ATP-binding protein [Thermomonas sp.]|uniref:ATP-binding protein n=1 Tax=Thermomonas sp. TaxID=1971895 RepID=UPI002C65F6DC|nr:ATP-binding protein [Thermomonas sp.]HRO63749.1 ATP-binding protein [Thermomonas sp.]
MRLPRGLSRQIVLSMSAVVLVVILLSLLGSYAFYALWFAYAPTSIPESGDWIPTAPEWAWMALTTFVALALAVLVAVNLARRILLPLTSVAESLRRVAQGELDARAVSEDRSLGEAALLVDDFNTMAERLQRMAQEQLFWNAAIAHELRTPVTILRGRLQGLAEGVFVPDATQFRSLLAQVEGLGRLIEDLRVIGLADSGHLDLHWHEVELSAEIEAVVQLLAPALQEAGFTIEVDLQAGRVACDPQRIRQALLALLENARRHAEPGILRIESRLAQGECLLRVEDGGPGIAPELAERLFDAFQRGEHSRSRESGGSGLGLAVVRAIAQAHGGQASCRPSPRGGSVFEIRWPAESGEIG